MKFTSISELTNNNIEIFGTKFLGRKDYRLSFFLSSKKEYRKFSSRQMKIFLK